MSTWQTLPAQFNVATWFVDRNVEQGRGARPAFHHEGRTLTYADVQELANRTGNALRELGIDMEDRVLIICLDAPEFLGAFWGAIKIGAIPIPVNTLMRGQDYLYFLRDSRAKAAVISAPLLAEAGPVLGQAPRLRHVLVAGGAPGRYLSFEDRIAKASSTLTAAETSRDDPAYWQYSSGSTGFPKGAVHLQHDMVMCCETYGKQVLGIRPTDRVFSAAKLFFAYGLGATGFLPMSVGAQAMLYPQRPTPEGVFAAITRYRPTLFFGIPTLFAAMLAVKDAEKRFDASSLRLCVSAGEALPEELYNRWRARFGVEIVDGIGTTEIGYIFISNRPGHTRPGSTGVAVPGYELAIVDDEGRPVPRGEIGNIRVKGDSTMAYYWNKHEKTKETLFGQWIQTGDKLADELKLFVKDKIAPYKYPRWIEFVTDLPKTATGKIQRFKLRA